MQTLPPNKTFKELGIDPKGKKFKLVDLEEAICEHLVLKIGDICEVEDDDGTYVPTFKRLSDNYIFPASIERFALLGHSWDNLTQEDVGAKFKDEEGNICVIMEVGVSGKTFAARNEFTYQQLYWNSTELAKKDGWTFLDEPSEPETVKMTVAEVSKLVGKKVEIVE